MPDPADIGTWTEIALEHNLRLLAARHDTETTRLQIKRMEAAGSPTLDAFGSIGLHDSESRSGDNRHGSIGLRLNVPLFSGGSVASRTRESQHRHQRTLDVLERERRRAQRETREAYLGVSSGISRVRALEQAVRCLKPGRPQAPGAPADRGLGPAEAPGDVEQPATAILGVEGVGQTDGDVLTRHPAAEHGGSLLLAGVRLPPPRDLTLAGPRVNRYEKVDRDAAEWLPAQNRCWFAARTVAVRQRYGLTVDRREADALDQVLAGCASTELIHVHAWRDAGVHDSLGPRY